MPPKVIFHIDMNSYFASCEQQANPALRGKPVGVCEHLGGIIIAPSIQAKALGVKTAMPVWDARKLCPGIILVPTDPQKYRATTEKFLKVLYTYTERIEKYSIDEAFLDMTENFPKNPDPWQDAARVAVEIKAKILRACGECITCSVGIADNKLLAKIGSDLQKPDGLTVIRPDEKHLLYDRLKLTDIPGIARRTERSLNSLGIHTLKDLRDFPYDRLIGHFGIMGHHLYCAGQLKGSWGEGSFGGERGEVIKSMGHAYTMPARTSNPDVVFSVLCKLSEMVGRRLRVAGRSGLNVHCVVGDFSQQVNVGHQVHDGMEIFLEAAKMFERHLASLPRGNAQIFRYVGVTVSGLKPDSGQVPLFDREQRAAKLVNSLDKINDKYGDFTVSRVPAWKARSIIRDSIGFGRMKEFKVSFKNAKER